ncbi:MAG: helix-turn-helix domain-containing protein [Atribacterota bacterium]
MEYYSIAEIARILKIPESTARYYRDRHPDFMDHIGRGRKKRYKKQALEAMRLICELADNNKTAVEIEEALDRKFNRNIESEEQIAVTTAGEQQLKMFNVLDRIADQKDRIQTLEQEVKELKEYINKNRLTWWQKLMNRKQEK